MSEASFDYIVAALHLIANEAWKLLPLYRFDPGSGLWHQADGRPRTLLRLDDLSFDAAGRDARAARASAPESALARQLDDARRIIRAVETAPPSTPPDPVLSPEFERIRWFPLPGEAHSQLYG
jgi:hypothetical protein